MDFYKVIILLSLFLSCNKENYVKTYSLPKSNPIIDNNDVRKDNNTPFSWIVPQSWSIGGQTSMRLATYNAPYKNGVADISITNFSGDGGGLLANINRWRKQLRLDPLSIKEINNAILVKKSGIGDYSIIKIINEDSSESAFLCAIMEIKNNTIFVKMNASIQGINQLEKEFITFCSSFN